ncbi:MAG: hypothetical protein QOH11_2175, partial [Solirubrobacteraceae bacterium]|nr:hypothetical protein [Solirubrobacteraceae bacterium]
MLETVPIRVNLLRKHGYILMHAQAVAAGS